MLIKKEKILQRGLDVNIKINLGVGYDIIDEQEEINKIIDDKSIEFTTPPIDTEVYRYKHESNIYSLKFKLYNKGTFSISYPFTEMEINSRSNVILNSFFILDFYDTTNPYTQKKIFSGYLTKITSGEESGTQSYFKVKSDNQFYYLYIPQYFIDLHSDNDIWGYVKFSFYNAKTGKVSLFRRSDLNVNDVPNNMYVHTKIHGNKKKWGFYKKSNNILVLDNNLELTELVTSKLYNERVNRRVDNLIIKKQNYPDGYIFNDDGTYTKL